MGNGNPLLGRRIRAARDSLNLSRKTVVEAADKDFSTKTLERWENGEREIPSKALEKLSEILGVSISFLMGESNETGIPEPSAEVEVTATVKNVPRDQRSEVAFLKTKLLKIPVIDPLRSICAGNGFQYCGDDGYGATDTIYLDSSFISIYDDLRQPYAVHVEGDSMEGAGIPDGATVVCNPAEEVSSGDSCVVCVGDDWFVKWVFFKRDGSVELKSAGNYPGITISAEDAAVEGYFRVAGKVVAVVSAPKRGA